MSAYSNLREDFRQALVLGGVRRDDHLSAHWREQLPSHIREVWLRRYYRPVENPLAPLGQYVNHFLVGADPEFSLGRDGGLEDACDLNLKAGLAWGADNNGRLAELRPVPSRSCLRVVASIGAELRWMSWLHHGLMNYQWKSGAWTGRDGLGGHVHFGRKKKTLTPAETAALDTLCFWLYQSGIFNYAEGKERYQRTRGHGGYGRPGDIRWQLHGWEYRTLPSWLDSPWLAYFSLTLSKLAVFDPQLLPRLHKNLELESPSRIKDHLSALLAYYQHRDDDAALAYAILVRRDFPKYDLSDFKPRWGIFAPPVLVPQVHIIPDSVEPAEVEVREMAQALLAGRPPEPVNSQPTWHPHLLPENYVYLPDMVQTRHAPGLGELMVGLCTYGEGVQVRSLGERQSSIYIGQDWARYLSRKYWQELKLRFPDIKFSQDESNRLTFATGIDYKRYGRELKRWLWEGQLPIWRVEDVQAGSYTQWQASRKIPEAAKAKPAGKYSIQL